MTQFTPDERDQAMTLLSLMIEDDALRSMMLEVFASAETITFQEHLAWRAWQEAQGSLTTALEMLRAGWAPAEGAPDCRDLN